MSKHIMTFDEWRETDKGREACDMTCFKALPKKHHAFVLNRIWEAYLAGCEAVIATMETDRVLTPPEADDVEFEKGS